MSASNRRLIFVAVGLVVIVGAATRFLSTERLARAEPLSIARADSRTNSAVASPLEDPGEQRDAPSPATAPSHAVVEVKQPQSVPEVVRFLRSALPKQFGKLTPEEAEAITSLDLRGATITDTDLIQLAALPNLANLCLHGTAITDAGMAYLRNIPKLTSIDLRATKVTGAGVLMLPTERIEALHLTDTQVKGEDLRSLPPMPKLQVLKLNRLSVDDTALASLPPMPSLTHVELDGTKISDDGLRRLLLNYPGIKRVELRETPVTAETIAELVRLHPGIELVQDGPRIGANR
jgi:hypothetical protein